MSVFCRDTKLDYLVEWDLDFCNKLLPNITIIIIIIIINIIIIIIINFMVISGGVLGQVMNTLVP